MILSTSDRLAASGEFADIFVSRDQSVVYKVARAYPNPRSVKLGVILMEQEARAYEVAHSRAAIPEHLPACFGLQKVTGIVNDSGGDVSSTYCGEFALALERVEWTTEHKRWDLDPGTHQHAFEAMESLERVGLDASDASVLDADLSRSFKLIDFTTSHGMACQNELVRLLIESGGA